MVATIDGLQCVLVCSVPRVLGPTKGTAMANTPARIFGRWARNPGLQPLHFYNKPFALTAGPGAQLAPTPTTTALAELDPSWADLAEIEAVVA